MISDLYMNKFVIMQLSYKGEKCDEGNWISTTM